MAETPTANPAPSAGRVLAFAWNIPALFPAYLRFTRLLRERRRLETFFLIRGVPGKLLLLRRGFQALAIEEIALLYQDRAAPAAPDEELDHMNDYDRLVQNRYLPPSLFPQAPAEEREYFRWQGRTILAAIGGLIDDLHLSAVISWNQSTLPAAALVHAARERGLPAYVVERGLLPGHLTVDPLGVNYGSHLAGARWAELEIPEPTPEEVERVIRSRRELIERGVTVVMKGVRAGSKEIRNRLGLPASAPIALLPLQIEVDSNLLNYSPFFRTMPEIIRAASAAAAGHPNLHLVVKPHPEDKDRLGELRGLLGPRDRMTMDFDIPSLLDAADLVVTVNSTVGLEALIREKPVVLLGQAIYGEKGFTFDLDRPDNLPELLVRAADAAREGEFNLAAFHRFLIHLYKHCLFCLAEDDPWQSRERILDRFAQNAVRAAAPDGPIPAPLEGILRQGRAILAGLSPADSPRSLLLVYPPPSVIRELEKEEGLGLSIIRPGRRLDLLRALARRFDLAVDFTPHGPYRRWFSKLLRAHNKAVLAWPAPAEDKPIGEAQP